MKDQPMNDEIDLMEYFRTIWKNRRFILCFVIFVTSVSFIYVVQLPKLYEANVSFLTKDQAKSGGVLSSLLDQNISAGLLRYTGVSWGQSELKEIIKSYQMAEKIYDKLSLDKIWKANQGNPLFSRQHGIERLRGSIDFGKAEFGGNLIVLTVQDTSPTRAVLIAKTYTDEITIYYKSLTQKDLWQRKEFVNRQLPIVFEKLKFIENQYSHFFNLLPSGISSVGSNSIEGIRLKRELELQNNIYIMLKKEQDFVELEMAKTSEPFMILDLPQVPEFPVNKNKRIILVMSFVLSLFFGILFSLMNEYIHSIRNRKNNASEYRRG